MPLRPRSVRGIRTVRVSLDYGHCAARRCLAALEPPWEASEHDLLVEHLINVTAEVLDVDHVVGKKQRVHDLVVGLRKDFVEAATELLLRLFGLVGPDAADDRVHGVVGAAGVDRDPPHTALQHPLGERARRTRVADEVFGLVDLGAVCPVLGIVPVIAGVDDQDVATLDSMAGVLLPALEMLGVDDASGPDEEVERQVADELAAREKMRWRIHVGADVHRHRDLLAAGLVESEPFDPADRRSGIAGERRSVQREVLREVDELHLACSGVRNFDRSTLPIAFLGSCSITMTRRGHLYVARRSRAKAMSSTASSGCVLEGTTKAVTSSPQASLGMPATATSSTAGCVSRTSSTSRG